MFHAIIVGMAAGGTLNSVAVGDRIYRSWLVIEKVESGVATRNPEKLTGIGFSDKASGRWERRGELAAGPGDVGPRVDPFSTPMRLDLRSNHAQGQGMAPDIHVRPCIFKYEGGNLVIAYGPGSHKERVWPKGEDYPGRPTEFKSTKDNGVVVETLKPCRFYDQD